jgi:class 3 adenylate cyclase
MQQLEKAPRNQPERILRTVLFSDVVASTDFIDRWGDSAWLELIDRHARAVCAVARHHSGQVVSFLGDGFMLMFCDPALAVECAIRLQHASQVQDLVRIRIGLDHGEVFQYRDGWYVGRTIHVASRLADICGDDEIVVSGRCMDHARHDVAAPAIEPQLMAIRGLREPCLVYVLRPADHT